MCKKLSILVCFLQNFSKIRRSSGNTIPGWIFKDRSKNQDLQDPLEDSRCLKFIATWPTPTSHHPHLVTTQSDHHKSKKSKKSKTPIHQNTNMVNTAETYAGRVFSPFDIESNTEAATFGLYQMSIGDDMGPPSPHAELSTPTKIASTFMDDVPEPEQPEQPEKPEPETEHPEPEQLEQPEPEPEQPVPEQLILPPQALMYTCPEEMSPPDRAVYDKALIDAVTPVMTSTIDSSGASTHQERLDIANVVYSIQATLFTTSYFPAPIGQSLLVEEPVVQQPVVQQPAVLQQPSVRVQVQVQGGPLFHQKPVTTGDIQTGTKINKGKCAFNLLVTIVYAAIFPNSPEGRAPALNVYGNRPEILAQIASYVQDPANRVVHDPINKKVIINRARLAALVKGDSIPDQDNRIIRHFGNPGDTSGIDTPRIRNYFSVLKRDWDMNKLMGNTDTFLNAFKYVPLGKKDCNFEFIYE